MNDPEHALAALGLELREPIAAAGCYVPYGRHGQTLYVSGQLPRRGAEVLYTGRLGRELTLQQDQEAARLCTLRLLSAARDAAGPLAAIEGVIELTAYVGSAEAFTEQSRVADAASGLVVAALGEKGRHARAAIGATQLPSNAAVEIKAIFSLPAR